MFKKFFTSFYFMPVFFLLCWGLFAGYIYLGYTGDILRFTKEGGLIEDICHIGYVSLLGVLLYLCDDYIDRIKSWGMFLFLAMCAFLREEGLLRHLSRTDSSPFKSRFFLNPNNPIGEKIVFGAFLIIVLGAVLYLMFKYVKPVFFKFFKLDAISWSICTMCGIGLAAKFIDRFPANYRKANGVALPDDIYAIFQLVEEASEMFLPYMAIIVLVQYHLKAKA